MKNWYKITGYGILILSGVLWGLILIIPWLDFSKKEIAGIMTILVIAGEITFYLSIFILGKSILVKLKSKLMFWRKKTDDRSTKPEDESTKPEAGS